MIGASGGQEGFAEMDKEGSARLCMELGFDQKLGKVEEMIRR